MTIVARPGRNQSRARSCPHFLICTLRVMRYVLPLFVVLSVLLMGCATDLSDDQFTLIDQDGSEVQFPEAFEGKKVVMSFVYTNCPDICPMITARLKQVESRLNAMDDVHFVLLTFDPERDTPEVLARYADTFNLSPSRWTLLTGEEEELTQALQRLDIEAVRSFTRHDEDGNPYYFIDHTDRVTLIDSQRRVRHTFTGSKVDPEELIDAIQTM